MITFILLLFMETVGLSHLSRDKLGHIHSDAYSIIQIENSTILRHQMQIQETNISLLKFVESVIK